MIFSANALMFLLYDLYYTERGEIGFPAVIMSKWFFPDRNITLYIV